MIFWDASAVLPLVIWERETRRREAQLCAHAVMAVWWGTRIECHSAIRRRQRDGELSMESADRALARLEHLSSGWFEVNASEVLRLRSERLLKTHHLRAADAMQLAAALLAFDEKTAGAQFYTSDKRLGVSACAEGLTVG